MQGTQEGTEPKPSNPANAAGGHEEISGGDTMTTENLKAKLDAADKTRLELRKEMETLREKLKANGTNRKTNRADRKALKAQIRDAAKAEKKAAKAAKPKAEKKPKAAKATKAAPASDKPAQGISKSA